MCFFKINFPFLKLPLSLFLVNLYYFNGFICTTYILFFFSRTRFFFLRLWVIQQQLRNSISLRTSNLRFLPMFKTPKLSTPTDQEMLAPALYFIFQAESASNSTCMKVCSSSQCLSWFQQRSFSCCMGLSPRISDSSSPI